MTFEEMQDGVHQVTRDTPQEFITPDDVKGWLNQGARKVAERTKVLTKVLRSSDVGAPAIEDGTLVLPDDVIDIRSLRMATFDDVDFDVSDDDWFDLQDIGGSPSPSWGRVFAGKVEFLPEPVDGYEYSLRYVAAPTTMVDDDDVCELPVELHDRVVFYARAEAFWKLREDVQGEREYARFDEGLPPEGLGKFRTNPGPRASRYEPNVIDRQYDSAHRG